MRERILPQLEAAALAGCLLLALHAGAVVQGSQAAVQETPALPVASPTSALAVVTESLRHAADDLATRQNYTYQEREVEKHLDANGNTTKTVIHTYDIVMVGEKRLTRLIAKDDRPLSDKEAKKEEDRMRKEEHKAEEHMRKANPSEEGDQEKGEDKERSIIKYLPEIYTFTFSGEEVIAGEPVWIINAAPLPSYRPRVLEARLLKCMRWKLWISKNDYHWVKREGEAIDDFSLGLFLVKLHKGMHVQIEQAKINNEVWLPRMAHASNIDARIAWHTERIELETTYSNYKKFRADTKVTGVTPTPPQ